MTKILTELQIPIELAGCRLDQALAQLLPEFSRSRIQQWIKAGAVNAAGLVLDSPKQKMLGGEALQLLLDNSEPVLDDAPEALSLNIVYEDSDLLVINKPAGLVVHPAAGNRAGTLLNGLLFHAPELAQLPRAGIVHRLDKDTTGLMVVAKTLQAHHSLVDQLASRSVSREYRALVLGDVVAGRSIDLPMGRHPRDRKKMAVRQDGKEAITHIRVQQRYQGFTDLAVSLETGRTHQIRVHLSHHSLPIVGDSVYGGRRRYPKGLSEELRLALETFPRQALHAQALSLLHPRSGELMRWQTELPDDMQALLTLLARDAAQ